MYKSDAKTQTVINVTQQTIFHQGSKFNKRTFEHGSFQNKHMQKNDIKHKKHT